MLASPGAISDVNAVDGELSITVLDNAMMGQRAYTLDPNTWRIIRREADYVEPKGLTGRAR
jgi:uncharacterized 2Fe-2S/4Fe-4S cluster protein (DUF4445 family)